MRIQHWSQLICGLLLALSATSASAQQPGAPGSPQYALQGELEELPPVGVAPQVAPYDQGAAGGYPMDPQAGGYAMDPGGGYAGEGLPAGAVPGGGYPGQEGLAPWPQVSPYEHMFEQTVNEDGLWKRFVNDNRRQYFANLQYLALQYKKPGGAGNEPDKQIGFPERLTPIKQFQIYRWDAVKDDLFANGFQFTYGFKNQDQTGMEIGGFYGANPDEDVSFPQRTFFPTRTPARFAYINRVNLATGSISNDPLIFDHGITARYGSQAYGAEGNMLTTPILGRGSNMLQGLYGLRYLGVNERMSITGNDSVTKYTFIDLNVQTQLVGPQFGLRWHLGGEHFKLRTFANAGALANMDTKTLRFVNYGTINDPAGPYNGNERERHSHISPMLELGIQGEAPLFSYLPLINRIPVVKEGVFQIGYKWTNVWLMDRPADSITYGDPVPQFDTDRESWSLKAVNLGIQWNW